MPPRNFAGSCRAIARRSTASSTACSTPGSTRAFRVRGGLRLERARPQAGSDLCRGTRRIRASQAASGRERRAPRLCRAGDRRRHHRGAAVLARFELDRERNCTDVIASGHVRTTWKRCARADDQRRGPHRLSQDPGAQQAIERPGGDRRGLGYLEQHADSRAQGDAFETLSQSARLRRQCAIDIAAWRAGGGRFRARPARRQRHIARTDARLHRRRISEGRWRRSASATPARLRVLARRVDRGAGGAVRQLPPTDARGALLARITSAHYDSITGLPNQRAARRSLEQEGQRSRERRCSRCC